jgi:uncharacterized protein YceH (UPF0502 family)
MASVGSLYDLEPVLETLVDRGYARRLERRPGQKEDRFEHLLGRDSSPEPVSAASVQPRPPRPAVGDGLEARVEALEVEVAELREQLAAFRNE